MKGFIHSCIFLMIFSAIISCNAEQKEMKQYNADEMIVRISEIKIDSSRLTEYLSILKDEAAASVEKEPGVVAIYPMFQKKDSTEIRILEIYADQAAYESHLQTPHFKHYKTSTLDMVQALNLVDMKALDGEKMGEIFKKLN